MNRNVAYVSLCIMSLQIIIIAVTVYFRKPHAWSTCSIFPLCMESNALECCLDIFCTYSFNESTNCLNSRICWSISSKTVLMFSENFLKFRSDMTDKLVFINLCSYNSESYTSVVLCDCKVALLLEMGGCSLLLISHLRLDYIRSCIIKVCHEIFLSSIIQAVFYQVLQLFCF